VIRTVSHEAAEHGVKLNPLGLPGLS
jgi:hypothetical protein